MSKLLQTLNAEIERMVSKAIREKVSSKLADLSGLVKRVDALEKSVKALVPEKEPNALEIAAEKTDPKAVRLSGKQIRKIRTRLNMTQLQLARLLDVTMFSVNHWEMGKTSPRKEQRAKIAALRGIGKQELKAMLTEKGALRVRSPHKKKAAAPKAQSAAETATAEAKN